MLRVGAGAVVLAVVITAGALGATGLLSRRANRQMRPTEIAATPQAATPVIPPDPIDSAVKAVMTPSDTAANARAPLVPQVPLGESTVSGGFTATRVDSTVTLSFDMPMARTRIPERFERLVRATLPAIYGSAVDSVLAKIPMGGIAAQGDLITDLPTRGVRVPLNDGWAIRLYPETRPGKDGPLVIHYRVAVSKS